jgi:CIC family chloride channel protein
MPSGTEDDQRHFGLLGLAVLAFFVGCVGGVGAWGFRMLIGLVHNVLFLGEFAFFYDANLHTPPAPWGWWVILVPAVGAVAVAWLVKNFAPEAKGHGVPEVMEAIHYNRGRIRPRVAVIKSLASAISIGSGGAVGREGPIVQIGSAFGSIVGDVIRLRTQDRITLIAAGAGAGIAATFNAPLGGIVFAIELLLVSINARNLLVVILATSVATYISRILLGTNPSFYVPALERPDFYLTQPWNLLLFLVLGGLMGLVSVAFIKGIYGMEDVFDAMPGNYYTRHVLGMLCVGVMIALLLRFAGHYYVQGVGYATIMDLLHRLLNDPWLLLLLLGLKLLATTLSLGSGASGGVFSPGLFIGATGGAAFGHFCLALAPGLGIDIPTFAIAGMAAVIAGTTGAALTGIIMLSEMTQDQAVILPLVISVTMAYAVRKLLMKESIYTMKLISRGHIVPEGLQSPLLASKPLQAVMETDFAVASVGKPIEAVDRVTLVESEGRVAQVIDRRASSADIATVPDDASRHGLGYAIVGMDENLRTAPRILLESDAEILLVSRRPTHQQASDIVGFVTAKMVAKNLKEGELIL